ncbi:hybrid sensor histidine kinase/response regulator [Rhodosalinus halophilus]|uniref:histidine kinase n=1 Tax=Rhodosalinus halophilus TaxID=2259333 RepID=A0A365U718_9RHOB|nr:hybrid sensor histidine kinase/response regulator [Rhodosalinus halophilus]
MSRTAWSIGPRLWILPVLGAALVALGLLAPDATVAAGAHAAGATLIAVAGLLRGGELLATWRRNRALASIADFVANDAVPCLITDATGALRLQNAAADRFFGAGVHETLAAALRSMIANPAAVVGRLHDRALTSGTAREDVVTRKGQLRVSAQRIGRRALLWRIEPFADRAAASGGGEALGVPRLTVGRGGAVLFMNDAARRLTGGRVRTLDAIFDAPPVFGEVARVAGADGPVNCLVARVEGGGRDELYLFPAPEGRSVAPPVGDVENLPVALLKLAPDGRLLMANAHARLLLRLDEGERRTLGELTEGLGRPISVWLEEALRGQGANRSEFLRLRRRSEDVFVQVTLSRSEEGGEPVLLAVLNDATELKTLESQFVQSQKMQAIGQLAGGIAHDFNNLLTAISGHCDLLLRRHDEGDPDYADLIQVSQNANRAAALVTQLLAFSRKQTLSLELLDLRDTLSDITHLLNRLVGERITLSFSHDADLPPLRLDKRQLEQVMMNLVVNARDAMPEGGEIRIETERLTLSEPLRRGRAEVPAGDYALVRVTDEGAGIPPEQLDKIFEPFFTTKRTGEGTGLGLSTVYGIVKQTGGFVFADSAPGAGTTFLIYLPIPADTPVARPDPADTPEPPEPERRDGVVLLVEDETPVRAFASRALRLSGHTVLEACSAEEALDMVRDGDMAVDVFVTDVVMPGMDGPSWVREALKERPEARVVFVSGYAQDSFEPGEIQVPNAVFLPKPFSLEDLTRTVQRQLH